ncbi:MAG: sigma-54-dependent Fis family transcriptional regulator [Candidatus Hydrogenedentes bacterium]|nr:sigma-54-dependent Fis family transcriptional regulator [Candidatus Hydrogenedentota bacterium]
MSSEFSDMTFLDEENGAIPEETQPKLILVLDTDPGIRWAVQKGLTSSGFRVRSVSTVGEALGVVRAEPVAAVILEMLPEAGLTLETLTMLLDTPAPPRVVCVSVDAAPQMVIECMRSGAADFLPKPFSLAEVRSALSRALAQGTETRTLGSRPRPQRNGASDSYLIGISPVIQEMRTAIEQVARTDLNCLLRGASGTGKDMVARELHRLSRRSDKPFIKVNCTALPEHLLESELFGYEKGAFTGAVSSKPGRFELANNGIIFLDEIGDVHPNLQAKLLQVIEHKEFTKLGGTKHIQVDVQIIAATNADLEQKTKDGSFRDDLYFRLNEVSIWVPPLSSRKEDIPLLVRHFVRKHGRFVGDSSFEISGEDLASLTQHEWPGNVRELESTIKRWLALGTKIITTPRPTAAPAPTASPHLVQTPVIHKPVTQAPPVAAPTKDEMSESTQLLQMLERHQWNRKKTAEALGMSYQTLRRRIEKFGLDQAR